MKWFLEIRIHGERRTLEQIVGAGGYEVLERHDGGAERTVLSHQKYADFENAYAVYKDGQELRATLKKVSDLLGEATGIALGAVQSVQGDGATKKDAFGELHAVMSFGIMGHVTVARDPSISEEERKRLEAEAVAKLKKALHRNLWARERADLKA